MNKYRVPVELGFDSFASRTRDQVVANVNPLPLESQASSSSNRNADESREREGCQQRLA